MTWPILYHSLRKSFENMFKESDFFVILCLTFTVTGYNHISITLLTLHLLPQLFSILPLQLFKTSNGLLLFLKKLLLKNYLSTVEGQMYLQVTSLNPILVTNGCQLQQNMNDLAVSFYFKITKQTRTHAIMQAHVNIRLLLAGTYKLSSETFSTKITYRQQQRIWHFSSWYLTSVWSGLFFRSPMLHKLEFHATTLSFPIKNTATYYVDLYYNIHRKNKKSTNTHFMLK